MTKVEAPQASDKAPLGDQVMVAETLINEGAKNVSVGALAAVRLQTRH